MFAKKLFYVSASLFLLAAAYHLGATRAGAQSGAGIEGASSQAVPGATVPYRASGVVGRTFYLLNGNGSQVTYPVPIPGTSHVVATDPGYIMVLLDNGDWLQFTGSGWDRVGNLLGAPTPAATQSFGALKAKYR